MGQQQGKRSRASLIKAVRGNLYESLGKASYLVAERIGGSLTSADSFGPVREVWSFVVIDLASQESQ